MKPGLKFIATYSAITFLLLLIAKLIFKEVTMEIFAYTAYYYLLTLGAAIVLFPIVSWMYQKNNLSAPWRLIFSIIFIVLDINWVPFFLDNGRILTIDVFKGIFSEHSLLGFQNLGIHMIALISFVISYVLFRKDNIWLNVHTTK